MRPCRLDRCDSEVARKVDGAPWTEWTEEVLGKAEVRIVEAMGLKDGGLEPLGREMQLEMGKGKGDLEKWRGNCWHYLRTL